MPIVPILVPGEHLEITADLSDPDKVSFSGSARTYEFYNFCIQRMLVGKDFAKYKIALNSGSPDSSSLKRKLDTINHLTAQFIRKTIFNTDCGLIVVLALIDSQNGVVTYTKQELNELREKFKDDSIILGQLKINEDLQGNPERLKPKPANGSYLATFKLPDINGKQVRLDQFKGKYVLLDFWASWCGPCRKQMPYIKKLSKLYHQNNFVIVSVSVDKNHGDWKKAMLQEEITALVNLIDDSGWKSSVLNQYNISSIPSNFLIDPAGKVIDKDLKGEKLLARVAEAMKMVN
jgi:thiol-disulfide isomerase/thioredoxin